MAQENVEFEILDKEEAEALMHQDFQAYNEKAKDFFGAHGNPNLDPETKKKIIKHIARAFFIGYVYGVAEQDVLAPLMEDINDLTLVRKKSKEILTSAARFKAILDNTIREGRILRDEFQPQYPEILKDGRLVVQIPSIVPAENKLNTLVRDLNASLQKEGNDFQQYFALDVQKGENSQSYFIAFSPNGKADKSPEKKFKAGSFLQSKLVDLKALNEALVSFDEETLNAFINVLNNNEVLTKVVETDKGKRKVSCLKAFNDTYKPKFKLDEALFLLLKMPGTELNRDVLLERIASLSSAFQGVQSTLTNEQVKTQGVSSSATDENMIDTLIFSNNPRQIAWMSAYTNFTSCMNPNGCNHHYVKQDIGQGTIVVWGVNSKRPHRRISRLLVKPYTSSTGDVKYNVARTIYGHQSADFLRYVNHFVHSNMQNFGGNSVLFEPKSELYLDGDPQRLYMIRTAEDLFQVLDFSFENGKLEKQADGTILVHGDIDLFNFSLTQLPDMSNYVIDGKFVCKNNPLVSLKGSPREVRGDFDISSLSLSSLEGISPVIGGKILAYGGKIKSLKGLPECVHKAESFLFEENDGFFRATDGHYYSVFDLPDKPLELSGDLDISGMELKKMPNLSKLTVMGDFYCGGNPFVSVGGMPKVEGRIYFDESTGFVRGSKGQILSVYHLPKPYKVVNGEQVFEPVELHGNVNLRYMNVRLPDLSGAVIKGDFSIKEVFISHFNYLPYQVEGMISADENLGIFKGEDNRVYSLLDLPKNEKIRAIKPIRLCYFNGQYLPDMSQVEADNVCLGTCRNLKSLKGFLKPTGGVAIWSCYELTSLEGLPAVIPGDLSVSYCERLVSFGDVQEVNGKLHFRFDSSDQLALFKSLPKAKSYDFSFSEHLKDFPDFVEMPESLKSVPVQVSRMFAYNEGKIYSIKKLPKDFVINEDFDLYYYGGIDLSHTVLNGDVFLLGKVSGKAMGAILEQMPYRVMGDFQAPVCRLEDLKKLPFVSGKLRLVVEKGVQLPQEGFLLPKKMLEAQEISFDYPYFAQEGRVYNLENLRENFVIKGDVHIPNQLSQLPDLSHITVEGDFVIEGSDNLKSFEGIPQKIGGNLVVEGSRSVKDANLKLGFLGGDVIFTSFYLFRKVQIEAQEIQGVVCLDHSSGIEEFSLKAQTIGGVSFESLSLLKNIDIDAPVVTGDVEFDYLPSLKHLSLNTVDVKGNVLVSRCKRLDDFDLKVGRVGQNFALEELPKIEAFCDVQDVDGVSTLIGLNEISSLPEKFNPQGGLVVNFLPQIETLSLDSNIQGEVNVSFCSCLKSLDVQTNKPIHKVDVYGCEALETVSLKTPKVEKGMDIRSCDQLQSAHLNTHQIGESLTVRDCKKLHSLTGEVGQIQKDFNLERNPSLKTLDLQVQEVQGDFNLSYGCDAFERFSQPIQRVQGNVGLCSKALETLDDMPLYIGGDFKAYPHTCPNLKDVKALAKVRVKGEKYVGFLNSWRATGHKTLRYLGILGALFKAQKAQEKTQKGKKDATLAALNAKKSER